MATKVIMPQGGQDLTSGRVVRWLKKEGAGVKKGEVICEVETEKAVLEVASPQDGVLLQIIAKDGEEVAILSTIGFVGAPGETVDSSEEKTPAGSPQRELKEKRKTTPLEIAVPTSSKIIIEPKARKLAMDNNLPLESLTSQRPDGKITTEDVERELAKSVKQSSGQVFANGLQRTITPDKIRKTTARRLSQSWSSAPHIFVTVAVDMTNAVNFRKSYSELRFTFNDFIIRACVMALQKYPNVNASFIDEDTITIWADINIGIAVAAPQGLLVPVLEDADRLNLEEISAKTWLLVEKTNAGKQELTKPSRFTISNLGMYHVDLFTAVINPPEAAILAVSSIRKQPVVVDGDKIAIHDVMNLTLSLDHRVGDGVLAAEFMNSIREALENPETLL